MTARCRQLAARDIREGDRVVLREVSLDDKYSVDSGRVFLTGVLAYAAQGKVIDIATFMDAAKLKSEFASTIGLTSDGDKIWSVPTKADVDTIINTSALQRCG